MWKAVTSFYNDINPATLSGAIDIVVVRGEDGELTCSPFHVRFGKLVLLRTTEKQVVIAVNDEQIDIPMKIGDAGEAFFVVEMDGGESAPSEYATSPIIKGMMEYAEGSGPADAFELGERAKSPTPLPDVLKEVGEKNEEDANVLESENPVNDQVAPDSTVLTVNETADTTKQHLEHPVGSPGWQWNWGGLPVKNEGETNANDVEKGIPLEDEASATEGAVAGSTRPDIELHEKVPIPSAPVVASSLTAALRVGGGMSSSPEQRGIVSVDEKVDIYLSSMPADQMASPDQPPSLRVGSPSPLMGMVESGRVNTNLIGSSQSFGVLFSDGSSTTIPQIELSLCGKAAMATALFHATNPVPSASLAAPAARPITPSTSPKPTTSATLAPAAAIETPAQLFDKHMVTFESFSAALLADTTLVCRINGAYYDWSVVSPVLVSAAAFGKLLPEEEIKKLIQASALNENTVLAAGTGTGQKKYSSFGNLTSWWSRGNSTPQTAGASPVVASVGLPAREPPAAVTTTGLQPIGQDPMSRSPVEVEDHEATSNIDEEREKNTIPARRYIKSLRMTSDQLKGLNLKKGVNTISFTVTSRLQGTATCTSKIFLWEHDTRVVISDVDGTITKSDVLGHVFTMVGQDWTHSGVASLYTNIHNNGYEILYLTSRAIGQADYTRNYMKKVEQGKFQLPEGPIVMSPDRLFAAFNREVIQRRPQEFKISCLLDIKKLFGPNVLPFYAGFGNRITDLQSYRAVEIPLARIFTIDPKGDIKLEFAQGYKGSYDKLNEIVDKIFPPVVQGTEVMGDEEFWEVWRKELGPEVVLDVNADAKIADAGSDEMKEGEEEDADAVLAEGEVVEGDEEEEEYEVASGSEFEEDDGDENALKASEDDATFRARLAGLQKQAY
ncbi:Lipin-3 [Podochytrium sp. JEL0797]|nr:Lipin-3 [Podochytrium sp. JEL0797]